MADRRAEPWLTAAALVTIGGVALELSRQSVAGSLSLGAGVAAVGWVMSRGMRDEPPAIRRVVRYGPLVLVLAVLGLDGLAGLDPWLVALPVVLCLLSPIGRRATWKAIRWLALESLPRVDPAAWAGPTPVVRQDRCTDERDLEGLRRAWAASFQDLASARDPRELEQVVQRRRVYLDRLERLDPDGFDEWLHLSTDAAEFYRPPAG